MSHLFFRLHLLLRFCLFFSLALPLLHCVTISGSHFTPPLFSCLTLSLLSVFFSLTNIFFCRLELFSKRSDRSPPSVVQRNFWYLPFVHTHLLVIQYVAYENTSWLFACLLSHQCSMMTLWISPEATMPIGVHLSVSVDRNNSVAKETTRCSRKLLRRANVKWRLKAGYEIWHYFGFFLHFGNIHIHTKHPNQAFHIVNMVERMITGTDQFSYLSNTQSLLSMRMFQHCRLQTVEYPNCSAVWITNKSVPFWFLCHHTWLILPSVKWRSLTVLLLLDHRLCLCVSACFVPILLFI